MDMSSSISGIRASFTRQDVSAHDVANINTQGYNQRNVNQTETSPSGTRVSDITRTPNANPQLSGTELAQEAGEQISSKHSNAANVAALKVKDRMLGDLLDIIG